MHVLCFRGDTVSISLYTVALYRFVKRTYTVRENVSSLMITVELAPNSGILLNNITLTISSVGGSATGLVLIIKCKNICTKMLKDVGMEVPKNLETRSKCSMHADKGRG